MPSREVSSRVAGSTAHEKMKIPVKFLADRTNGRAIATVLRLSVYLSSVVCDVVYCG